ncbi:MAG: TetR/AcrR family transcriptional regulator [bacterium]|nr:TetR/AcrR family transcriptional regulator [bacterium]
MSRSEARTRVRPPKQERSRQSLQRILETAREFLSKRTPPDVSLREIATAAGVSASSLFARFPSKDALLDHLHVEFCQDRLEEVQQVVSALERSRSSLHQITYEGIYTHLDRSRTWGGLERAFEIAASQHDRIRQREESFQRQRLVLLTAFGTRLLDRPEGEIESLLKMVLAGGRELSGEAPAGDELDESGRQALAQELTVLVLRALGVSEQAQTPSVPEPAAAQSRVGEHGCQDTHARILAAGLRVFDGRRLADISEEEIAAVAGIPPEELRAHFENKVLLLHALLDDFSHEVVQTIDELAESTEWEERTMRDLVRDVVTRYMLYWERESGVIKTIRSAELSDEALFQRHYQLKRDIEKRVLAVVKLIGPGLAIEPGDEGRFRRTVQVLAAATRTAVERPYVYDITEGGIGKEQWLDEFVELALRALDLPEARGNSPVVSST